MVPVKLVPVKGDGNVRLVRVSPMKSANVVQQQAAAADAKSAADANASKPTVNGGTPTTTTVIVGGNGSSSSSTTAENISKVSSKMVASAGSDSTNTKTNVIVVSNGEVVMAASETKLDNHIAVGNKKRPASEVDGESSEAPLTKSIKLAPTVNAALTATSVVVVGGSGDNGGGVAILNHQEHLEKDTIKSAGNSLNDREVKRNIV